MDSDIDVKIVDKIQNMPYNMGLKK